MLNFQKPDRLPVIEWAPYWTQTVDRWKTEGLPTSLSTAEEVRDYFELDRFLSLWIAGRGPGCPHPKSHGAAIVRDEAEYDAIRPCLYPDPAVDPRELERLAKAQQEGAAVWCWIEGFFWYPRTLFGIEEHLYAFFDQPDLMRRMNEDLLEFQMRAVEQIGEYLSLQFLVLGEDMSYNHGPMISKAMFDEHLAPFYRRFTAFMKGKGIPVIVDSDGRVDEPVDWYSEVGCVGFLPLEKQAGVDVLAYRRKHPDFRFVGAFDKMCMHRGEDALRSEFERLFPLMKEGGYIPGVDHQTPPEVSIEDYRLYLRLLREYCEKAAKA